MKKLFKGMVCLALAVMMIAAQFLMHTALADSADTARYGEVYMVNTERLNVRKSPNINHYITTVIKRGASVTYIEGTGDWWYVRLSDGRYGYVSKKYLAPIQTSKVGGYFVTASELNIRQTPSVSGRKIGSVSQGTMVMVSSFNGDWGYVSNGANVKGWVALRYLSSDTALIYDSTDVYTVTATMLNVRSGASVSSRRIRVLPKGTQVQITRTDGNWGKIFCVRSGKVFEGWVCLDYLKRK